MALVAGPDGRGALSMSVATEAEALAELHAADRAHDELVARKYAAIGKRVGAFAPELDQDPELIATWTRAERARVAFESVCEA